MAPAHLLRTALAAIIAATFAVGVLAAVWLGPLQPAAGTASALTDHRGTRSLGTLLTGAIGDASGTPVRTNQAVPAALPSPCRHNQLGQLVAVSIERQHAWACSGRKTVLSTPVTTGATAQRGHATPRGSFAVQALTPNTTLRPSQGGAFHVRYWIPFRMGEWGFHDASWQKIPYGSEQFKRQGSRGCVHVPLKAMRQLFHFVHPGTKVRIR